MGALVWRGRQIAATRGSPEYIAVEDGTQIEVRSPLEVPPKVRDREDRVATRRDESDRVPRSRDAE